MSQTVADVLARLPKPADPKRLDAPRYAPDPVLSRSGVNVGLAVASMSRHMTDEGYQLFVGLSNADYWLGGLDNGPGTDLRDYGKYNLRTLLLQDKREWCGMTAGKGFDPREAFTNVGVLRDRTDVFKGTVLKDAQNNPAFHCESAAEIGCHFWVVYYHPDIVAHVAPFVRREHLVRTYHTVDPFVVPEFAPRRKAGVLSGAVSSAYPLRQALVKQFEPKKSVTDGIDYLKHPGYGRTKCHTPDYLKKLSEYKVSVCTSSVYGYALRKIVESTAAGCVVVTDLPKDDVLPEIDGNLVRIKPTMKPTTVFELVRDLASGYDADRQREFARKAVSYYAYRAEGVRLAARVEELRGTYPCS